MKLSRKKFLESTALGSIGMFVASIESFAIKNNSKKIKVAIIGCGSVSTQYLPHLSKCEYVELVSVCDIIFERAMAAAEKYGVPNKFKNIQDLLAGPHFRLMVTLTDMQEHGRLNKMALDANRNVWSEKPLANTYKEGKALLDLAKSKKIRLWGAPAVVNYPQFAFMAQTIKDKKLGKSSSRPWALWSYRPNLVRIFL